MSRRSTGVPSVAWAALVFTLALCTMVGPALAEAEPIALDVVFALDESASMRAHDPDGRTPQLVVDFARALASGAGIDARVGLVGFADSTRLEQPLGDVRDPAHRLSLSRAVAALEIAGRLTDSPAGIDRALYELSHRGRPGARKAIVVITDGGVDLGDPSRDEASELWLRGELADACANAGVRIYGVAYTDSADAGLMQSVARRTDGRTHDADTGDELILAMDAILADLIERAPPDVVVPLAGATGAALSPAPYAPLHSPLHSPLDSPPLEPPTAVDEGSSQHLLVWLWGPLAALLAVGAVIAIRRGRSSQPMHPLRRWTAGLGIPASALGDAAAGGHLVDRASVSGRRILPLGGHRARVHIGREPHNDIVVPGPTVSSSHAWIESRADGYFLEDRQSTHGTWLNGRRLSAHRAVLLKDGDEIRFADYAFAFGGGESPRKGETEVLAVPRTRASAETARGHAATAERSADPTPSQIADAASQRGASARLDSDTSPEPRAEPASEPATTPIGDVALFLTCIDGHLDRVARLSAAHRSFIDAHFATGLRRTLAVAADELMRDARRDQLCKTTCYGDDGVLYLVCVVPDELEQAPAWMGWSFGGFSRLLHSHVAGEAFRDAGTRALCLITFGRSDQAWLSLSVIAAEGGDASIDLLSTELLSEEERAEFERTPRGFARPDRLAPTSARS